MQSRTSLEWGEVGIRLKSLRNPNRHESPNRQESPSRHRKIVQEREKIEGMIEAIGGAIKIQIGGRTLAAGRKLEEEGSLAFGVEKLRRKKATRWMLLSMRFSIEGFLKTHLQMILQIAIWTRLMMVRRNLPMFNNRQDVVEAGKRGGREMIGLAMIALAIAKERKDAGLNGRNRIAIGSLLHFKTLTIDWKRSCLKNQ